MSIEEELDGYLNELRPEPQTKKSFREAEADRLIAEARQACREIARVLFERGVPQIPFMVRSDKPGSLVTHFFKGDASNPLVPMAQGWVLVDNWAIDTSGEIWAIDTWEGDAPVFAKEDLIEWKRQLNRDIWQIEDVSFNTTGGFVSVSSMPGGSNVLAVHYDTFEDRGYASRTKVRCGQYFSKEQPPSWRPMNDRRGWADGLPFWEGRDTASP